tara:strand:- start:872 stop:1093 length:222 start_codon:yes stop_codon:yes gene_type:complete
MTTENNTQNKGNTKPTHNICKSVGHGKNSSLETIGAAWSRDDGGLYIKLHGTQIIEGGFYAFPINKDENGAGQ